MRLTSRFLALILLIVIASFQISCLRLARLMTLILARKLSRGIATVQHRLAMGILLARNACIQEDKKCVAKCKAPVEEPPQN